jgi:altronate hydrolase
MVVPQLFRTLRNPRLAGVSATSWTITMSACFTWMVYGIKAGIIPQIPGNLLLFPGAAAIALAVPARLSVARRAAVLASALSAIIIFAVFARPEDIGYLAFTISLVSALPQTIMSLARRRLADGRSAVSVPAWVLRGGSQVFWLIYGLAEHNGPIIVTAAITLTSALLVLAAETSPLRLDARASFPASDMLNVCCALPSHDARITVTDPTARGIRLQPADDVAITTGDVAAGTPLDVGGQQILLRGDIPRGHKLAVRDIGAGDPVRRYGQVIGYAQAGIAAGEHVHLHNLEYREFERAYEFCSDAVPQSVLPESAQATFQGYVRSDGSVGTRNFLGILTTVNCSATAARQIANRMRYSGILDDYENVDGMVALTHGLGCGMAPSGEGIDVLRRVMRGYLAHPNFAGFLILGLGCEDNQVKALTDGLQLRADLQVSTGTIQEIGGTKKTVAAGIERLTAMLPAADKASRETVPASRLVLGTNCGGSDSYSGLTANPALGNAVDRLVAQGGTGIVGETPEIYGAEHLLTRRAATEAVGRKLLQRIAWWHEYTQKNGASMDANPSPGNKAGGITTILEKSLGAVAKGGTSTLADVVEYAEPVTSKGFVFMDTPGYDPVSVTGIVAGGANVVCFTTGRGSAFGCAPVPSIKIATSTALYEHMNDDMDINAGRIVDGTETVEDVGAEIFRTILAVASGEETKSESMDYGEEEFVPWHIGTVM